MIVNIILGNCEKRKKNTKILSKNYWNRLARALSTTGQAGGLDRQLEQQRKCLWWGNCLELAWHLEMLVAYLNNPSEETIFGSDRTKKQHETMKLQNEEVMLS